MNCKIAPLDHQFPHGDYHEQQDSTSSYDCASLTGARRGDNIHEQNATKQAEQARCRRKVKDVHGISWN
jgi:hypothetical protein